MHPDGTLPPHEGGMRTEGDKLLLAESMSLRKCKLERQAHGMVAAVWLALILHHHRKAVGIVTISAQAAGLIDRHTPERVEVTLAGRPEL